jgi:hypothetical protein
LRLVGDVGMPADGADLRRRDPQSLQGIAPLVSRGAHGLFWKRRGEERIASEALSTGALVNSAPAAAFAGAFLGCLATLHLSAYGFVPAIASALATVLLCGPLLATRTTGLFPGEFFAPIYGGTFAGMTPVLDLRDNAPGASLMPASALFVLLSIVSGIAFCAVAEIDARSGRRLAAGYGGRSGAIATVASFLFVEAALLLGADDRLFRAAHAEIFDADLRSLALTCAAGMIGMCATLLVLRRRSVASAEPADRIFIAAGVALIGLIVLHVNDRSDTRILDAFYAGCFLGMSSPERLKGWIQLVLGGILLTVMLVLVRTLLPDIGGELGFAALVTVAMITALNRTTTWLMNDKPTRGKSLQTASRASADGQLIPGVPVRNAIFIAGSLAGLLLIGWLALSDQDQVASEEPALDTAASERVAEQPAPLPGPPVLVQAKAVAVDDAVRPGTASAVAVNAGHEAVTAFSPEPNVTAIQAAQDFVGAADAAAERGRAARAEAAATATIEAARRGTPVEDVTKSHEELFRAFMRWRAERAGAMAQPRPQPVKRSHNPAVHPVRPTPADLWDTPRGSTHTSGIRAAAPGQSLR